MNKVKAFTLMELVVVLFISGLVFSLAVRTYTWFQTMLVEYEIEQNQMYELKRMEYLLSRDVKAGEYLLWEGRSLQCISDSLEVRYIALDSGLVRIQNGVWRDTLGVKVIGWNPTYWGNAEVRDDARISSITVETQFGGSPLPFTFVKNYGADALMSLETE